MKGRIYISGPMSGLPNNNYPRFNRAAVRLRNLRWEVVNPVAVKVPDGTDWLGYMAANLETMRGCTALCLIPGWQDSFGARMELLAAQKLEMDIYDLVDLVGEAT